MLNKKLKDLVQATLVTVFGLSSLALIGNTPAQAASLEITDFTSLNDPASIDGNTYLYGINNHGVIIGNLLNPGFDSSILYHEGNYTAFNAPNAEIGETYLYGINNRGEIVGEYNDANGNTYGFLDQGGNYTTLDDPSAITGPTIPTGISNDGEIVGEYNDPNGNIDNGGYGALFGINGDIDGFLDQGGYYTTLNYPNAFATLPSGINNHGEIVGNFFSVDSNDDLISGSFLYKQGNYTVLNDPSSIFNSTQANAINDRGVIVGDYFDATATYDGFIYQDGTYTTVNYPGAYSLTEVTGINDKGDIVGFYNDANGNYSGFTAKLKEVPEPGTIPATFVFGVGLITARLKLRRKQKASLAA